MARVDMTETEQGDAGNEPPTSSRFRTALGGLRRDPGIWRRGILLALCAVGLTLLMVFHADIPNRIGNLGSLTETFLPWLGLLVPVLLVLALLRRSATALIALVLLGRGVAEPLRRARRRQVGVRW